MLISKTDKTTMEFESFRTVYYYGVQENKAVPVDSVIAILGKKEDISALLNQSTSCSKQEAAAQHLQLQLR